MSTRKLTEKNIRKLTKVGGSSIAVTIPIEIIKELKWREKQNVIIKKVRGGVLVKDWKK